MQLWGPGVLSAPTAAVVAVVLPFLLAEASYRWLERPILRRRPRQVYGRAISARAPMTALPTEATRSIG
jgi:peptidoglycan/LPS O-acetylase OafA/YrhL